MNHIFNNCTPLRLPSHRTAGGQVEQSLEWSSSLQPPWGCSCWSPFSGCNSSHTIFYDAGLLLTGQSQSHCQDSAFLTDTDTPIPAMLSLTVQSQTPGDSRQPGHFVISGEATVYIPHKKAIIILATLGPFVYSCLIMCICV